MPASQLSAFHGISFPALRQELDGNGQLLFPSFTFITHSSICSPAFATPEFTKRWIRSTIFIYTSGNFRAASQTTEDSGLTSSDRHWITNDWCSRKVSAPSVTPSPVWIIFYYLWRISRGTCSAGVQAHQCFYHTLFLLELCIHVNRPLYHIHVAVADLSCCIRYMILHVIGKYLVPRLWALVLRAARLALYVRYVNPFVFQVCYGRSGSPTTM